jgi:hypothetical protein
MFTQMKSAIELADLVVDAAQRTVKCSNLTGGVARANGHPGDWKFSPAWTGSGVSDVCLNEVTAIETLLKQQGFGLRS